MNAKQLPYESRIFPGSSPVRRFLAGHLSVEKALFVDGIPADFMGQRYRADEELQIFERPDHSPILRFGSGPVSDFLGVDLATGNVVQVIRTHEFPANFVNTSLQHFVQTIQSIYSRFPFHDLPVSDEQLDAVAGELTQVISEVDPLAAVDDSYWSSFVDDVQMGDLSTDEVRSMYR